MPSAPVDNVVVSQIAVVGMACRFPGADSPGEFWSMLESGANAIGPVPADRAGCGGWANGDCPGPEGGYVTGMARFDAGFFEISAREARAMDPQQRLLLECAVEAVEDAGWPPSSLAGSEVGVYVGQTDTDYWDLLTRGPAGLDFYGLTGTLRSAQAGRIAHALDLRGPAVSVDTACSSSLVALDLACQALRAGACTAALVGGAHIILSPYQTQGYTRAGMLSPRGRCSFGDVAADGFVRSEGVAVVALRPLRDALAAGDRVRAVVLATASNNNGRSSGAMVAPSARGQAAVLRTAYARAGVDPGEVAFVEAHGTGTPVGDPVELAALTEVFGHGRRGAGPLLVGSVKGNIGHCEATAGLAGLIKAVLSLEHGMLPAQPGLRTPATATDVLTVPDSATPLNCRSGRAIAGVSSTGLSGTNAHVVLAAAARPAAVPDDRPHLLALSARTPQALRDLAAAWSQHLDDSDEPLRDLAFSASTRRDHHRHRLAVVAADTHSAAADLRRLADDAPISWMGPSAAGSRPARVAFVFPGQGGQWAGMGQSLAAQEPVFADTLRSCDRAVEAYAGWSVWDAIVRDGGRSTRVEIVQPSLWAIEMSLAALWRSWGIEPGVVIGHSMGEVAAACVAGALTPADGAAVICTRSTLAARATGRGAMAMVELGARELEPVIAAYGDDVSVAAHNSPAISVISGDPRAVAAIVGELDARGVLTAMVAVDFASHCRHMDPLLPPLLDELATLRPQPTTVGFRSTVTGVPMRGPDLSARYWADNLRRQVRFAEAVTDELTAYPETVFVEISPHPVLLPALRDMVGEPGRAVASTRRNEPERACLLGVLAQLYRTGACTPGPGVFGDARYVTIPGPPWQRSRHWFDHPGEQPEPSSAARNDPSGSLTRAEDLIRHELSAVIDCRSEDLVTSTTLRELGMDSLMASEFRYRVQRVAGFTPTLAAIVGATVAEVIDMVTTSATGGSAS